MRTLQYTLCWTHTRLVYANLKYVLYDITMNRFKEGAPVHNQLFLRIYSSSCSALRHILITEELLLRDIPLLTYTHKVGNLTTAKWKLPHLIPLGTSLYTVLKCVLVNELSQLLHQLFLVRINAIWWRYLFTILTNWNIAHSITIAAINSIISIISIISRISRIALNHEFSNIAEYL